MNRNSKLIIFVLVIFSLLLACSIPGGSSDDQEATMSALQATQAVIQLTQDTNQNPPQDDTQPTTEQPPIEVPVSQAGTEGVTIFYNPDLVDSIQANVVPAALEGAYQYPVPRHVQFTLPAGTITLVPIHYYELVYEDARPVFTQLQNMLSAHNAEQADCIPELPLTAFYHMCSHQEINANIAYLEFKNGTGVRFVTVYAIQDFAPVDNQNLRYIFQGVTNDGECYITVEFVIHHASLPASGEIPQDVYLDTTGDIANAYFGGIEQQLGQAEVNFDPLIGLFDNLISYLEIGQCGVNQ
jgi:hypothetical protein